MESEVRIAKVQNGFVMTEVNVNSPVGGETWVANDAEKLKEVVGLWVLRQKVKDKTSVSDTH
jgi:hypothetical protein